MQFLFITFEFYLQSFPLRNNQIHLYHLTRIILHACKIVNG